ncbi:unnamed protein product, partial [Effrenium voratum]
TLVTEVMMDHSEPAHLTGNGLWQEGRRVLYKFVNSRSFDYVAGVIIMLNMVMIGVEAELSLHDPHVRWAAWVERAFLAVYAVELVLRLLAGGRKILHSSWFWLDFFLVAVGLLASYP